MIQGDSTDPGSAASWGELNTGNVGPAENAAGVLAPHPPDTDPPNRGGYAPPPAKPKAKKKPKPASTVASRSATRTGTSNAGAGNAAVIQIITRIAKKYGVPPALALAIAFHESGFNPSAPGDKDAQGNPTSFGLFQLHIGGELGNSYDARALDPAWNAERAISVIAKVYNAHPTWDWGQIAAAAQRPKDAAAYAVAIDSHLNAQRQGSSDPEAFWTAHVHGGTAATSVGGAATTTPASASGDVHLDNGQLEKSYGSIASLLKDTALQKLVGLAVAGGWDDQTFTAKLQQSDFYRKHSDIQRNWLMLKVTDPGEAQNELRDRERDISKQAMTMGITMAWPDIRALAESTLYNGQTGNQINDAVGAHFQYSAAQHGQGQAGTYQDQFTQLAQSYGVPVSDVTIGGWVQKVLGGQMTPDTVKSLIEQQALTLYPGLSTQIKSGQTTADVASTYRDTMSNLLELNPASVTLQDPTIKKALQYSPDPTKPPTLMPMWQFEQNVRQDPRWLKTDNAKQSVMGTGLQILKDWGLFSG